MLKTHILLQHFYYWAFFKYSLGLSGTQCHCQVIKIKPVNNNTCTASPLNNIIWCNYWLN